MQQKYLLRATGGGGRLVAHRNPAAPTDGDIVARLQARQLPVPPKAYGSTGIQAGDRPPTAAPGILYIYVCIYTYIYVDLPNDTPHFDNIQGKRRRARKLLLLRG